MPEHLDFAHMRDSAEAITAQAIRSLADEQPRSEAANFRHTLLLVFEEISRHMPQERVHDGIWESSFEVSVGDLTAEPFGPLIPGSLEVDSDGFDLDTLHADLFRGTFTPNNDISPDLVITGNRVANAVILPIDQKDLLLKVQNIQIYRGSNLLIGTDTYSG